MNAEELLNSLNAQSHKNHQSKVTTLPDAA